MGCVMLDNTVPSVDELYFKITQKFDQWKAAFYEDRGYSPKVEQIDREIKILKQLLVMRKNEELNKRRFDLDPKFF